MSAPDTTETEALGAFLSDHFVMLHPLGDPMGPPHEWRCACGEKFGFSPSAIVHQRDALLASDWLATRDAAQRAEAWDEGYAKCSDDFEHHLNHASLFDCDCPEDPLLANPYRIGGAS